MSLRPTRMAAKPPKPAAKKRPKHPNWEPTHAKTKVARHALSGKQPEK